MENPIKMDDSGVPLFLETPILIIDEEWAMKSIFEDATCQPADVNECENSKLSGAHASRETPSWSAVVVCSWALEDDPGWSKIIQFEWDLNTFWLRSCFISFLLM